MNRILKLAVACAAATAVVGAANAADIRRPPPPVAKAPAFVAPLFTWTGFYIGANVGYGWGDGSGTVTHVNVAPVGARGPISGDGDGILGGIQIGYNWQTGPFVIGFETDIQASGAEGTFTGRAGPAGPVTYRGTTEHPWFGTIRGRLGYAADRWLFYFTGGGYYAENKATGVATRPGFAPVAFSSTETGWGWTVGGGVEWAFVANWSVKAEYLYLATPDKVPARPGTRINGDTDAHVVRLGVNYRF
jgi:outer membrane immunogenic protein